jgi:hypothetical protein
VLTFDEEKHEYRVNGVIVRSATQILKDLGMIDDRFFKEEHRLRGKAVHFACELYDRGDLDEDSVHPIVRPYLEAYKEFKSGTGFVPEIIEERFYDHILNFAVTPDRYGTLGNGGQAIFEIKSGGISKIYTALQTAAQEAALRRNNIIPKGALVSRYGLQCKNDGKAKLVHFSDYMDASKWISCCAVFHLKQEVNGGSEYRQCA